uniref:CCHC-type domain-containing protein n=1 Tax=Fagus sylvatica TaxID=28930 RepID=A0A2N9IQA4_FAGSY
MLGDGVISLTSGIRALVQVGATTGEDGKMSRIEKFDGTDFGYWKIQIEDYLYRKKLHLPLLGKKPDKMEDAEWALLDRQVLGVIRLTLSRSVAHNVVKETTTMGLMTALFGMYEKPSANNRLFNLKMAEGAAMAKHLNEFNTITNQLSSVEIEFDDEIRALIVLASLPNSWEAMRMAVSNSAGKEGHAFVTKNRGRSRNKWHNDRATFNDRSKSRDKSQYTETRECFHYGKKGHIRMNCKHWRKEQTEDKDHKHDDEKGTTVVVDDEEVVVLSVQEQKCEHVDNIDDEWVVNSAVTHHVICTKELFTTYKAGDFGIVKMGNTSYSKIVGTVMDRADYCNHLGNGRWKLAKGPMVVARRRICCGLYRTRVKACKKKFNAVGTIEKTPQSRVMVNSVAPKKVNFSLLDSATDGEVICDEECRDGKLSTCDEDEVKDSKDLEQGE